MSNSHRTAGILYHDLGMNAPKLTKNEKESSTMISVEILPEMKSKKDRILSNVRMLAGAVYLLF